MYQRLKITLIFSLFSYIQVNNKDYNVIPMNNYIEYLIQTYYLHEKEKHDMFKGRGTRSYIDDINISFENINKNMYIMVAEEYHITNMFDEVIDEIQHLYFNHVNDSEIEQIFTGYALKYINGKPNIIKLQENTNDSNLYMIYIKIIYDEYSNVFSAVEDKSSVICIELNSAKIQNSIELLRSSCKHEFLHVREMYSNEFFDVLQNKKNKIPTNIDNVFKWDLRYENTASYFSYLFQQSELRARLNAYAEFITLNKFINFDDSLEHTQEITLLNEMSKQVQQLDMFLNDIKNYSAIEIYIYYCQKYNVSHTNYKDFSFNNRKRINEYTQNQIKQMEAFIFEIKKQVINFKNNIHKQYFKYTSK